ncbi:MAG: YHS domain-containing protein [Chitinispirillaceae bacterium]|nr:YHS domain-containing protein [Chitinispirillaceae bacterium]
MRLFTAFLTGALLVGATITAAGEMKMHGGDPQMKAMQQKVDSNSTAVKLRDAGTQKTCPVTGDPVDKRVFVDYQGKRIYFCCASCKTNFGKDPAKYLKKMSDKGEKPALLALVPQKACPVMGGAIDKSVFIDYNGRRVYFCCGSCKAEFEKNPEKYFRKLEEMGEKAEGI